MDNLTQPAEDFDHLSPTELSNLVDMVTERIEYHQGEIARLRPILHRLQERIPDDYNHLMGQVKAVLNELN